MDLEFLSFFYSRRFMLYYLVVCRFLLSGSFIYYRLAVPAVPSFVVYFLHGYSTVHAGVVVQALLLRPNTSCRVFVKLIMHLAIIGRDRPASLLRAFRHSGRIISLMEGEFRLFPQFRCFVRVFHFAVASSQAHPAQHLGRKQLR
jgi:hypothetical protein